MRRKGYDSQGQFTNAEMGKAMKALGRMPTKGDFAWIYQYLK